MRQRPGQHETFPTEAKRLRHYRSPERALRTRATAGPQWARGLGRKAATMPSKGRNEITL